MNSLRPDHVIINAVLRGDTMQYNELVLRHMDYAYSIALKIVHNAMDAEEIAHDAFLKAYKSLRKFNQKAKFTTWLYRIVFNTAISHTRKNHLQADDINEITTQPESGSDSSDPLMNQDRQRFLTVAMRKLSPIDSGLITMFYLDQLSLLEIGEVIDIKPDLIKVKLFRARKRLAKELEILLEGEVKEII